MSEDEWTITDVKPHVMLCPLPDRFWWEVSQGGTKTKFTIDRSGTDG